MANVVRDPFDTKRHIKPSKVVNYTFRYIGLILLAIFFIFPVVYMILVSFLNDAAAVTPQGLFPNFADFSFESYVRVLTNNAFIRGTGNTLIVCLLSILGILIGATFCAYGLSKVRFKGQKLMFAFILATVFLPGTVTSIPLFTIYAKIGFLNTLFPMWLPIWFGGGAMNIFLVRQFMRGIPKSLTEAAVVDGANSFEILITVIVPLVKPILIYLAITTFISCWNDYQTPLLYLTSDNSPKTLALLLFETFEGDKSFKLNAQMATGVVMMVPTTILFALFQKELTEGVATIGIKA